MAEKKKEEHTTFEVGPISEPRMRALFEEYSRDIWRSGGAGREALREEPSARTLIVFDEPELLQSPIEGSTILEVTTMEVFRDKLYIFVSPVGKVYEFNGETFSLVYTHEIQDPSSRWRMASWASAVYKGKLYFAGDSYGVVPGGVARGIVVEFDGATWRTSLFQPNQFTEFFSMAVYGNNLYAGDEQGHIWRFDGSNWVDLGRVIDRNAHSMAVFGGNLYVGCVYEGKAFEDAGAYNIVYKYNGTTWTKRTFGAVRGAVTGLAVFMGNLYATDGRYGVLWISSNGATYTPHFRILYDYEKPVYLKVVMGELYLLCNKVFQPEAEANWWLRGGSLWRWNGVEYAKLMDLSAEIFTLSSMNNYLILGTGHYYERVRAAVIRVGREYLEEKHPSLAMYFMDDADGSNWKNKTILANDETAPIPALGWDRKTIYFRSNVGGTLTLYIDQVGDGDWQTYTTETIAANTLDPIPVTGDFVYVKLAFSAGATVTAKIVLQD